jgi:HEPN domain-containing protein
MKDQTKHWVELAEYDLETAEAMFRTKRYVYVVFMCHLCIEKLLKGCVVEFADKFPPKTHDWLWLARIAGIEFPAELQEFAAEMSEQSVPTRYPEDLKSFTKVRAQSCLSKTRELYQWLRQKLSLEG